MEPPAKRARIEESKSKELPLSDVLEWFDTTTQPYPILARDKEKKVFFPFWNRLCRPLPSFSMHAFLQEKVSQSIFVDYQELEKHC